MIRVLAKGATALVELAPGPDFALPPDTVWIDLFHPNREEELACEKALGAYLPTREEMSEIETSSRLYKEGKATHSGKTFARFLYRAGLPHVLDVNAQGSSHPTGKLC